MKHTTIGLTFVLLVLAMFGCNTSPMQAKDGPERFEPADAPGVYATRDDRTVYLQIDADITGPISIPRLAAPLRSMHWQGSDADHGLSLRPEQETWIISWKQRPEDASRIVLNFDAEPLLPAEVLPTTASADGSFYLPAHLAMPRGEKIRYEPQPYKNTVGYWTGAKDSATWYFKLDKPGRFSVAILQGCGKGQGGSTAIMRFSRPLQDAADQSLDFDVLETGHFQNFQWRHLGVVELKHEEVIWVGIVPKDIKKAALMDVRAIHLIRMPDTK